MDTGIGLVMNDIFNTSFDFTKPPALPVPERPEDAEYEYLKALFAVYEEQNKLLSPITTIDEVPNELRDHLQRQRSYFWAFESIRREVCNSFTQDGQDDFKMLLDDMYEFLIEVYEMKYPNGRARLDNVLIRAAEAFDLDSIIFRRLHWFACKERKGICHHLINEKKLRKGWVW